MPFDIPQFDTNKIIIEEEVSKFENIKNIEQQEKKVEDFVMKDILEEGILEYFPKGITVKKIDNNLFFVIDNNTNKPYLYVDGKGNNVLNIVYRARSISIKNNSKNGNPGRAMIKAGFVFGENLELHKIIGYKEGKLIIKGKVDTNSKEYYQAWKKIVRASGDIFVNTILHSDSKTKFHHNSFEALLSSGAVTKEILEKINAKGILTSEDYQFGLDFFQKQEDQEKTKTHIDEAIEDINSRLNGVTIEMPQKV